MHLKSSIKKAVDNSYTFMIMSDVVEPDLNKWQTLKHSTAHIENRKDLSEAAKMPNERSGTNRSKTRVNIGSEAFAKQKQLKGRKWDLKMMQILLDNLCTSSIIYSIYCVWITLV